jgi:hypothetical protein
MHQQPTPLLRRNIIAALAMLAIVTFGTFVVMVLI